MNRTQHSHNPNTNTTTATNKQTEKMACNNNKKAKTQGPGVMLQGDMLQKILEFTGHSVMIRSTCKTFRAANTSTTTNTIDVVVSSSLISWAMKAGCDDTKICSAAASSGNLQIIQMAIDNKCQWCPWAVCFAAAKKGHLNVLRWAQEHNYPWDSAMCKYAALNGHFEVLRWLHANKCPWNWDTYTAAVERGELDVLIWLRSVRCPWDWDTHKAAYKSGNAEIAEWVHANLRASLR